MPEQKDIIAGLDVSSLDSVTQAQAMQMVNQAAPLSNIGFVIYGSTTPDVINNPRFKRYIWLKSTTNPPTPYYYDPTDGFWKVGTIDVSDLTVEIVEQIIEENGVWIENVSVNSDDSADVAKKYYIARAKASGGRCELVLLDTALADGGGVGLNRISLTGAGDKKFLVADGDSPSVLGYRKIENADLTNGTITPTKLTIGAAGTVVYSDGTTVSWQDLTTIINNIVISGSANSMRVRDLVGGKDGDQIDGDAVFHAASVGMVPTVQVAGGQSCWKMPVLTKYFTETSVDFVNTFESSGSLEFTLPAWGGSPKLVRAVLANGFYGSDGADYDVMSVYVDMTVRNGANTSFMTVRQHVFSIHVLHIPGSTDKIRVTYRVPTGTQMLVQTGVGTINLPTNAYHVRVYAFY